MLIMQLETKIVGLTLISLILIIFSGDLYSQDSLITKYPTKQRICKIIHLLDTEPGASNNQLTASIKEIFIELEDEGAKKFESDDLYKVINKSYVISLTSDDFVCLIFSLDFVTKRNAEIGAYLSKLIYKIAMDNTSGFIRAYDGLNETEKKSVHSDLFWLKELGLYEEFLIKLDKLDQEKHKSSIEQIKRYFD